jgi:hypothetical protein
VDPANLAGDQAKTAAFEVNGTVPANIKPSENALAKPLATPTTLTTEVQLPAGTAQNAELKTVVSQVVNKAVQNYQQVVNQGRKPGPIDIVGTAGATGTIGSSRNSLGVAMVIGPEPATEMAKKLKEVQEKEAIKDIDFASKVASRMQAIEKAKKECEAKYEEDKAKLREEQVKREADKRWAIGKVTGEGEYGEMQNVMQGAKDRAALAKKRLLALIEKLKAEYAASKAKATDALQVYVLENTGKINKVKADWEAKKAATLAGEAKAAPEVISVTKERLAEMEAKKQATWDADTAQIKDNEVLFGEKWTTKQKELDARIAKLMEQLKKIDEMLEAFLAKMEKKVAARSRNREKESKNILAASKGEAQEPMEAEGSVADPMNADDQVKAGMIESEKAAQKENQNAAPHVQQRAQAQTTSTTTPKPCRDEVTFGDGAGAGWICEKNHKEWKDENNKPNAAPSSGTVCCKETSFATKMCRKFCGFCKAA